MKEELELLLFLVFWIGFLLLRIVILHDVIVSSTNRSSNSIFIDEKNISIFVKIKRVNKEFIISRIK